MDYIVISFILLAVVRGVISAAAGVYVAVKGSPPELGVEHPVYLALLRRVVPLLIAAVLVVLYMTDVLIGMGLIVLAGVLYLGELALTILLRPRPNR